MEKEFYLVVNSGTMSRYDAEVYESFSEAKLNALEAAQDNPEYEYYVCKAQKIGTAVVPLKAQYITED